MKTGRWNRTFTQTKRGALVRARWRRKEYRRVRIVKLAKGLYCVLWRGAK